ncbi:rhodanese-like domain-containing protein [Grimontia kaedaensis]|uniref:Rhodanese-like domain-containing protein n=1 Tax=Grimontia kaedaensis TaxID=2872157 RepID=A0ABY4X132_9GAMM|nr:rhodanese-like domain-containing protein [Grimontia kaedaensis]USH04952.1 rhodanese-like domain-containing protein [Grimontia kaedaensis]
MNRTIALTLTLCSALLVAPVASATERAEYGWEMIEQGAMVVDVRTPAEFDDGHLSGALNYPVTELDKHIQHLDKDTPLVLYCRSGVRSGAAYQYLLSKGFTNLHNAGGFEEMKNAK